MKCPFPSSSFWNTQVHFPRSCCFPFETPSQQKSGLLVPGRGLVLEDLELTQAVEAKGGLAASRMACIRFLKGLPIVTSKFRHRTPNPFGEVHRTSIGCFTVSMLLALQAGAIIAGHSVQSCEERCEVFWSDDSLGIEWCPMDCDHFTCFLGSVSTTESI